MSRKNDAIKIATATAPCVGDPNIKPGEDFKDYQKN
jgi:hypothetical protein